LDGSPLLSYLRGTGNTQNKQETNNKSHSEFLIKIKLLILYAIPLLAMKLHRNLVFAAVDALDLIFNEQNQADKVLKKVLKHDKRWGSRDRSFIAETVYDIVRWKRLYSEIAEVKAPYSRPNLFRLFAVWATLRGITIPDWKQIEPVPTRRIKGKFDELSKIRKYREAIPDWMDELGLEVLKKS